MRTGIAILVTAVVGVACGAIGFLAGGRFASEHWSVLTRSTEAARAGHLAEVLEHARKGNSDVLRDHLERSLDHSLVNVMILNPGEMLSLGKEGVRKAAQYRQAVPPRLESAEWRERVEAAVRLGK